MRLPDCFVVAEVVGEKVSYIGWVSVRTSVVVGIERMECFAYSKESRRVNTLRHAATTYCHC